MLVNLDELYCLSPPVQKLHIWEKEPNFGWLIGMTVTPFLKFPAQTMGNGKLGDNLLVGNRE